MEQLYLSGGPSIYIMDSRGSYRFNPNGSGYYWGMSGSATYPVKSIGCYSDFKFGDDVNMNDIRCDSLGLVGTAQIREAVHANFVLKSLFPLDTLQYILNAGPNTQVSADGAEYMGIGEIQRKTQYWKVYFPLIYDSDAGDWVAITIHKAQFVGNFELAMPYGTEWSIPVNMKGFADISLPKAQQFATIVRVDPSVIT
jgi:hypothetical protein